MRMPASNTENIRLAKRVPFRMFIGDAPVLAEYGSWRNRK
jgi:hypothetical protein